MGGALRKLDGTGIPLLLARLVVGVMMIRMGWAKVGEPVEFLKLLGEYELLPASWYILQNILVVVLPWLETIGGVLLIAGVLIRGTSLTFLVLLTGFTIAIVLRGMNIHVTEGLPYSQIHFDCGCGGGDVYFVKKIPENIGLWLLCWIGLLSRSRRFTLSGLLSPGQSAPVPSVTDASPGNPPLADAG
jgi:uncharacterized membrane protein YphA (DoxX/SURF4 family)